jgi:soluble lytic murein transglycosylase-like protein
MDHRELARITGRLGAALLLAALSTSDAVAAPPRAAGTFHRGAPIAATRTERVRAEVAQRARNVDAREKRRIARAILEESARAGLDPLLIVALIHVESSFDPAAVSPVGAAGLMQLRRSTMDEIAARSKMPSADPHDPVANVRAGVRYLAALHASFDDAALALMAYNAGPGRIRRYLLEGGVPERFWAYPRSIASEMRRLGAALVPGSAPLAANDAPAPRG